MRTRKPVKIWNIGFVCAVFSISASIHSAPVPSGKVSLDHFVDHFVRRAKRAPEPLLKRIDESDFRLTLVLKKPAPGMSTKRERVLGERYERGDESIRTLIRMGATISQDSDGQFIVEFPRFYTMFTKYYERVISLGLLDEDVIFPALVFKHRTTGAFHFVRVGIDPWPSLDGYEHLVDIPQFSNEVWFEVMSSGKMPIGLSNGAFFDHDLAHLSELFRDPDLMRAARNYFRFMYANAHLISKKNKPGDFVTEAFAIPDISNAMGIKTLISEIFRDGGPRDVDSALKRLKGMHPKDREREISSLMTYADLYIIKMGGSERDSYNVQRVFERDFLLKSFLGESKYFFKDYFTDLLLPAKASGKVHYEKVTATIPQLHMNHLMGIVNELRLLLSDRTEADRPAYEELILDRIARLEMGLYHGISLGLTPSQVYEDCTTLNFDPNSKTGRFLKSFVIPGTVLWRTFFE